MTAPASPATCVRLLPCESKRSIAHTTHGHTVGRKYSPTYQSWQAMMARCRYAGRDNADRYRDKGIVVAPAWVSFEHFLADMGPRPAGTTLDRIDGERGYSAANCRWATPREQARNTKRNILNFEAAVAVAEARLRGEKCKAIAARFGCSESLPREIVKGRCWPDALAQAKARLGEAASAWNRRTPITGDDDGR